MNNHRKFVPISAAAEFRTTPVVGNGQSAAEHIRPPAVGNRQLADSTFRWDANQHLVRELARANAQLKVQLAARTNELNQVSLRLAAETARLKEAGLALQESEQRFMAFMDHSPVMAFIRDEHGCYHYGNRRWIKFLGETPSGYPSPNLSRLHSGRLPWQSSDDDSAILATGRGSETVQDHVSPDGDISSWLFIKFPMLDPLGRTFVGGVAVDITERQHREKQVLEISEREQQRIGQDLHDELCQYLTAIKFRSALVTRQLERTSPKAAPRARALEGMLNTAIDRAHRLARGLYPVQLEAGGLKAALKELAANYSKLYHCHCRCLVPDPIQVHDAKVAFHLYRIAQEAISNAIKHGRAYKILVCLRHRDGCLTLEVKDDGLGLPAETAEHQGMGWHIMNYRARMLGATLSLAPTKPAGALLTCTLPATPEPPPL